MKYDKVVFIEIRYEDGTVMRAEGSDAEKIWKWVESATVMNHIHGMSYSGPMMKVVKLGTA